LVQPVDWVSVDEGNWWLEVRCPECSARYDLLVPRACAEQFEHELDAAHAQLKARVDLFAAIRMTSWAEAFARALEAGAIQPMDF
jgi:hypothetical protein